MADIRMRQKSPVTIKSLDRAAIAGDHLLDRSARLREDMFRSREDSGSPEHYAAGSTQQAAARSANLMRHAAVRGTDHMIRRVRSHGTRPPVDIRTKKRMLMESRKGRAAEAASAGDVSAAESVRYHAQEHAPVIRGTSGRETSRTAGNVLNRRPAYRAAMKQKAERKAAEKIEVQAKKAAETAAREAKRTAKLTYKALRRIIESSKALLTALGAGGCIAVVITLIFILFGAAFYFFGDESSSNYTPVSPEVEAYTPIIQKYAEDYGIPEYVDLIKAVMMQESGGRGTDPMQCSESPYNKKYSSAPGSIKDPEYSINCGVHYLADCIKAAGCKNPLDMSRIRLALQGYNYGNGYIPWAIKRDGGYTVENAAAFSEEQAEKHGWKSYGDKNYPAHVLRYYPYGSYNIGIGNTKITQVAAAQIGNQGGKKFWSWYGFNGHVSWCACFVSWCADQCGYIKAGVMPKFSWVDDGVQWFKNRHQWQKRSYKPAPGDIIFFDWECDGSVSHVGIVESCDGRTVHTIEGNSGDACKRQSYSVGSSVIFGYGIPKY